MPKLWRRSTVVGLIAVLIAAFLSIAPDRANAAATYNWVPTKNVAAEGATYTPNIRYDSTGRAYATWVADGALKSAYLDDGSTEWTALDDVASEGSGIHGSQDHPVDKGVRQARLALAAW